MKAGRQSSFAMRYVLVGSEKLAELTKRYTANPNTTHDAAQFYHTDAAGVSQRVTRNSPETLLGTSTNYPDYIDPRQQEYEPGGANVGLVTSYVQQPAPPSDPPIPIDGEAYIYADGLWGRAYMDGIPMTRQALRMYLLGRGQPPWGFWYGWRRYDGEEWQERIRFFDISQRQTQTTYTNKNKEIKKAIEDADSILRGENDCATFFGKYALKALAALDKLLTKAALDGGGDTKTGIRMSSPGNLSPEIFRVDNEDAFRVYHTGIVNSDGPFFNILSKTRIGGAFGYSPVTRETRVLQILHELAHMILKKDESGISKPLIPDDRGSNDSEDNSKTVLEKCKNAIAGLGEKK